MAALLVQAIHTLFRVPLRVTNVRALPQHIQTKALKWFLVEYWTHLQALTMCQTDSASILPPALFALKSLSILEVPKD